MLVNNAGRTGKTEGLLETSTEGFDILMKTNICLILCITKAAVTTPETRQLHNQHYKYPGLRSLRATSLTTP
jgi:NAD(P)-dependent dehydrogenase (short-subunit alcohol dehydrogenase family)